VDTFESVFSIIEAKVVHHIYVLFTHFTPEDRTNIVCLLPLEYDARSLPFRVNVAQPIVEFLYWRRVKILRYLSITERFVFESTFGEGGGSIKFVFKKEKTAASAWSAKS
jgi:hypothetical protein